MLFVAVILLVIGLIHLYLWKRLVHDTLRQGWGRRVGTAIVVVLGVLVPVTLIGVRNGYVQWLSWPGYLWVALMFYLLVTLAVLEVPRLIAMRLFAGKKETPAETQEEQAPEEQEKEAEPPAIDRRLVLARGAAIFAGLTAASITGYGVRTATGAPRIDRFTMPMPKLPRAMDGTRIAVVSDIHIGPLTGVDHARRITRVINSVNADLVCVVGDLVDGTVAKLGRFAAPLAEIESRRGTFFVTGNHEYYSGYAEWIDEVAELGMRPLRNDRVEIAGLDLAGVNDLAGAEHGDAPDFARALGDRDTTRPVVLMAHQPVAAKDAAPFGVDLQISGHTHGGQMAPFNLLVRLEQPVVSGFGNVDGVPVYVTNGAGYWGPPVRVGAPPQVTVIELRVQN
ncbi:metallophosphoesterase [Actinoplanes sp. NPDC023936]|uniref:metallophosphoesterase n=1 Tax=Actinoplanes sp. NPDC023936 TaxID=3154910 RepID=UPI0033EB6FA9